MSDGAHLQVSPSAAMRKIVGNDPISEDAVQTKQEFERSIRNATVNWKDREVPDGEGYDMCSRYIARGILEMYEAFPDTRNLSDIPKFLQDANGDITWENPISLTVTLSDVYRKLYEGTSYREAYSESSGFMWGWAVNAARSILDLGPLPNPAIIDFA